jgi:hypothetical protein
MTTLGHSRASGNVYHFTVNDLGEFEIVILGNPTWTGTAKHDQEHLTRDKTDPCT